MKDLSGGHTKVLQAMLTAAEVGDREKVLELNKHFEKIHEGEKLDIDEYLSLELDRTRQSIVDAVRNSGLRDVFLRDAKIRLESLTG